MPLSLDRLPVEKLQAVLATEPDDLDEELSLALRDFLDRIGGRENARLALKMLREIEARPPRW